MRVVTTEISHRHKYAYERDVKAKKSSHKHLSLSLLTKSFGTFIGRKYPFLSQDLTLN